MSTLKLKGKKLNIDKSVRIGVVSPLMKKAGVVEIGENPVIRSGSVIYGATRIGKNLQTGHNVIIRERNIVGDNFCIWSNSVLDYKCHVGNNVKIHSNTYIAQSTKIEDDVFIAPGVMIANDMHPGCKYSRECMKGPVIETGVQIGANVTILPAVRIGKHSVIGAGSVITKNIPPYSVVWGNPGRVRKKVWEIRCRTGKTEKPYKKAQ